MSDTGQRLTVIERWLQREGDELDYAPDAALPGRCRLPALPGVEVDIQGNTAAARLFGAPSGARVVLVRIGRLVTPYIIFPEEPAN